MSFGFARVLIKGEKSQIVIPRLPIDEEVFFSMHPFEILSGIGAIPESLKATLQREDGLFVEAQVFSLIVSAHGREDPTIAITFEGAQPTIGAKFLEDLGLRIDSESCTLASTMHRGFACDREL